ncbi:MAG: tyrosine-type recombinase/integrase [Acidimicrobiales bacterium]
MTTPPSTIDALDAYLQVRDHHATRPGEPAVFISAAGRRLRYDNFHHSWLQLVALAGLDARSARCRPRPHDLRHTFAVRTLTAWQAGGGDVAARLPALSTMLGHVDPSATYWYLTATPQLLAGVTDRLDRKAPR